MIWFSPYSQTWAYDHLSIRTTVLRYHLKLLSHKWPLNNDHLSTTATIFVSRGCLWYTSLTVRGTFYISDVERYLNYDSNIISVIWKHAKCQFHQHFMRCFFLQKVCPKLFVHTFQVWTHFLPQEYWRKCAHKMLLKLTTSFREEIAVLFR